MIVADENFDLVSIIRGTIKVVKIRLAISCKSSSGRWDSHELSSRLLPRKQ